MENIKNKKLIIFSSRSGGPYKQHHLLYKYLLNEGYNVEHWSGFGRWILLHFIYEKNVIVLTNIPFLFRFKKSGYYLNIHGNYNLEKSLANLLGYFYKFNLSWADKVIVPSDFLKNKLKIKKALSIHNFVEEIDVSNHLKQDKKLRLITVTNFSFKEKAIGVVHIIKSLSLLKTEKKIIFNIYGDGKFLNEIKSQSFRIELPNNIKFNFCGYSKNIIDKMSESDIFIYWSNLDVSPICLTEAMACGLPIVVNSYPAFKKCICKFNLFCNNEKEFSNGIDKLIANKIMRQQVGLQNKLFYKNLILNNEKILHEWKNTLYSK